MLANKIFPKKKFNLQIDQTPLLLDLHSSLKRNLNLYLKINQKLNLIKFKEQFIDLDFFLNHTIEQIYNKQMEQNSTNFTISKYSLSYLEFLKILFHEIKLKNYIEDANYIAEIIGKENALILNKKIKKNALEFLQDYYFENYLNPYLYKTVPKKADPNFASYEIYYLNFSESLKLQVEIESAYLKGLVQYYNPKFFYTRTQITPKSLEIYNLYEDQIYITS